MKRVYDAHCITGLIDADLSSCQGDRGGGWCYNVAIPNFHVTEREDCQKNTHIFRTMCANGKIYAQTP